LDGEILLNDDLKKIYIELNKENKKDKTPKIEESKIEESKMEVEG